MIIALLVLLVHKEIMRDKCVVLSVPGSMEKTVGWGDLTSMSWE